MSSVTMDQQMSDGNDAFTNNNLFANSQQFNSYDLFPSGSESNFNDAGWGVNASDYPSNPAVSRAQQPASAWSGTHHLSASSGQSPYNGRSSPYSQSLNQPPVQFSQNAYAPYGSQPGNFSFSQVRQSPQLQPHQHHQQQQQYDPSIIPPSASRHNPATTLGNFHSTSSNLGNNAHRALEQDQQRTNFAVPSAYSNPSFTTTSNFQQVRQNAVPNPASRVPVANQQTLISTIPKGSDAGLFSIISFDDLSKATNSDRMGNYLNIGKQAFEWNITRSALPAYAARKSRNELRRLAGKNDSLLAKIGKKSSRAKSLMAASRPSKIRSNITSASAENDVKYEQDSSSEYDSSDDDSYYSEDSDIDSPLPSKRPDTLKGAIEYDTIKALWRSKRKAVDSETIRKALVDFWEIVKTIRDRWKADAAAVTEAEDKKRTGELPLLRSRVKDQRDMLEAAFKAALKHGHRAIVELLSENVSLLFVCYQFLLDRFKEDDVNGGVSRAVLETMSTFTTLTESKLEKTHIAKVLPRYQKKGDAKTQYWLKKIQANVETATKAAGKSSTVQSDVKKPAVGASLEPSKPSSPTSKRPTPEINAGIKRAATSSVDGTITKKAAVGTVKPTTATALSKPNGLVKKPGITADKSSKPIGTTTTTPAVKKTVVAKPSGFFSNLQSASKKPGTSIADKPTVSIGARPTPGKGTSALPTAAPKPAFSFAETMANLSKPKEERAAPKVEKTLPPETADERKKRLRKEERRKLRVTFKNGDELEEVRIFVPHPSEDINHTSSEMRDLADIGGEGRMFKQQQHRMDIDDDEEMAEETEKLIDFVPPSNIDFSVVDAEERKRNYAPYGGGELQVESAERQTRESIENNTLMVVYTDVSEIPPNPREPADPYAGADLGEMKHFGDPEEKEKYISRVKTRMAARPNRMAASQSANMGLGGFNYGQQSFQTAYGGTPQATTSAGPDISSILAALQSTSNQPMFPQTPQASQATYGQGYANTPVMQEHHFQPQLQPQPQPQPQPAATDLGSIDLAAILAKLNGGNGNMPAQQGNPGPQASMAGLASFLQQPSNLGNAESTGEGEEGEDLARIRSKNPFYKTKVCKFWQEGRCQKGTSCSYLHE